MNRQIFGQSRAEGSGGFGLRRGRSSDDLYSVGELHTCDQLWQLVVAIEQGHSKNPSCDEGDRLGAILAEVFAGLAHGRAAGSDEVEDEIADRGERAGAGANATAILVHRHVTNVMQAVFDACACRKLDPYVLVMPRTGRANMRPTVWMARETGASVPARLIVVYPDSARIRRPPLPNGAIRILPNG